MARKRIELPSADELFGNTGPAATPRKTAATTPAAKKTAAKKPVAKKPATAAKPRTRKAASAKPTAATTSAKTATAAKKKPTPAPKRKAPQKRASTTARRTTTATAPAPNGHGASPELRLSALESRLGALPVDALIDLRDGLEELLAADVVDEAAVRGLLDSFDP